MDSREQFEEFYWADNTRRSAADTKESLFRKNIMGLKEGQYAERQVQKSYEVWQHQQAKIDAMKAMMKKHEWVRGHSGIPHCKECLRYKHQGHAPDCELDRLIKE